MFIHWDTWRSPASFRRKLRPWWRQGEIWEWWLEHNSQSVPCELFLFERKSHGGRGNCKQSGELNLFYKWVHTDRKCCMAPTIGTNGLRKNWCHGLDTFPKLIDVENSNVIVQSSRRNWKGLFGSNNVWNGFIWRYIGTLKISQDQVWAIMVVTLNRTRASGVDRTKGMHDIFPSSMELRQATFFHVIGGTVYMICDTLEAGIFVKRIARSKGLGPAKGSSEKYDWAFRAKNWLWAIQWEGRVAVRHDRAGPKYSLQNLDQFRTKHVETY